MINWLTLFFATLMTSFAVTWAVWPLRKYKNVVWISVPLLCGIVGLGYGYWGSWQAQTAFVQRNERQHAAETLLRTIKSPDVLVEKLQQHLTAHPRSARGWYLLGRLYASQHLWEKSYQAFATAYELNSHDALISVNYAQSLFAKQNPADDELARKILKTTLLEHPQQGDVLMLLAMDAQRRQAPQEALMYWRKLLLLVPESSPEADSIRKAIKSLN